MILTRPHGAVTGPAILLLAAMQAPAQQNTERDPLPSASENSGVARTRQSGSAGAGSR